jgi:PAS domain S-box-containing protein
MEIFFIHIAFAAIFLTVLTPAVYFSVHYRISASRSQREAQEARLRLGQIVNSVKDSYWVCSGDWSRIEYVSPESRNVWGITDENLSFDPLVWLSAVDSSDAAQVRSMIFTSPSSQGMELPAFRFMKHDSTYRWISMSIFPAAGGEGENRIVVISKDTTNQRRGEGIMDYAFYDNPCPMSVIDLATGCYVDVNNVLLQNQGISRSDVVGHRITEFEDWMDPMGQAAVRRELESSQKISGIEVSLTGKNGEKQSGLYFGRVIGIAGKKLLISFIINVTDQKIMKELLVKSRKRVSEFTENIPGVVFQFFRRRDGRQGFYFVSSRSRGIFGIEPEPLGDYPFRFISCLAEEDRERFRESISKSVSAGYAWSFESRFTRPDGSVIWIEGTAGISLEEDGESVATGFFLDVTSRKTTEDALRVSERKFRTLFDSMTEGLVINELVTDSGGGAANYRVIAVNPAYLKLTGMKAVNVEGRLATEIFGVETAPYIAEYAEVVKTGVPLRIERYFELFRKHFVMSVISPAHGQFAVIFEDVTEHKSAEEILRESESKYRYLFEHNPLPMLIYEKKTLRLLSVNDVFTRIYGYTEAEALSLRLPDLYPEQERELIIDLTSKIHGYANAGEWHHLRKDGMPLTIIAHSHDISYENRSARIAVITDISERKAAEDEIYELKNFLDDIINSFTAILLGVDADLNVNFMNREGEKFFGLSQSSVNGRTLRDAIPGFAAAFDVLEKDIRAREHSDLLKFSVEINEEKRFFDLSTYPLSGAGTKGSVIRIDEVTESVHRDDQLRQAQKMETVGTLAGGLAHDFNNVLGGIIGTVGLLRHMLARKSMLEGKIAEYMDLLDRAGARATEMVKQILSLSRRQELSIAAVDLNESIRGVIQICTNSFDKSIRLDVEYFPSAAVVEGDPTQVEQVFLNLCVNASHAMTIMRQAGEKTGGVLSVSISRINADRGFCQRYPEAAERSYWKIMFADTGIGMDEKTLSKIYDPFFTMKDKQHGTGLGLAMTYNIVHQHKGFLDVYSEPGVGSTFNVYLPRKENDGAALPLPDNEGIVRGAGTILVIDDEEIVRSIASGILSECGYDVVSAENGSEGIARFTAMKEKINLVLLDMAMPGISGKDVFIELRKIDPGVKVLLSSGFRQDVRVEETIALGVNGFIQKPYSMIDLSLKVKEIIEG